MNNSFAALLSALSYVDAPVGMNLFTMKQRYQIKEQEEADIAAATGQDAPASVYWDYVDFSDDYLRNVEIKEVFSNGMSFNAYILLNHNTKQIEVVFRGTQEKLLDNYENAQLLLSRVGSQEASVPLVVNKVYELYTDLLGRFGEGWSSIVNVTGHSLGGHLARTFSEVSSSPAFEMFVECVVFNAPIPLQGERGRMTDVMLYSDPTMWDFTAGLVHNGMKEFSDITNKNGVISDSEGHGIISIVNALSENGRILYKNDYVRYCDAQMRVGTIVSTEYGSAASFLDRVFDNWNGRVPNIIDLITYSIRNGTYKVNLDDDYARDGIKEEFTQVEHFMNLSLPITVNAGSHDDSAFLGKGNVTFDGGFGYDLVSYKLISNGVVITETQGPTAMGARVAINDIFENDILYSVEKIEGTQGEDVINSVNFTSISGLGGNDVITGGTGREDIFGGDGDDVVKGNGGDDRLYADAGFDFIDGGSGQDALYYTNALQGVVWDEIGFADGFGYFDDAVTGFESLHGSKFGDHFDVWKTTGIRWVYGGDGDDTILGSPTSLLIYGQGGNDILEGRASYTELNGGDGSDQFVFRTNAGYTHKVRDFQGAGEASGDFFVIPTGSSYFFTDAGTSTNLQVDVNQDGRRDILVEITDGAVTASAYTAQDVMFW